MCSTPLPVRTTWLLFSLRASSATSETPPIRKVRTPPEPYRGAPTLRRDDGNSCQSVRNGDHDSNEHNEDQPNVDDAIPSVPAHQHGSGSRSVSGPNGTGLVASS